MKLFKQIDSNKIRCLLCPHNCTISKKEYGKCRVRTNINGQVILETDNIYSSISIDHIEKKPLTHFLPGTKILSLGSFGCNLSCSFCQNWTISQTKLIPEASTTYSPLEIITQAVNNQIPSIAYTYNEPTIQFETVTNVAEVAKEHNIKNVAVTSGYISDVARESFFKNIDGVNVDLKSINNSFYKKFSNATIGPVLKTLEYLATKSSCWLEISNLIIPGENDSEKDITNLCRFIKNSLGPTVPIHFSAFYPMYKLTNLDPTPATTIINAIDIAKSEGLYYPYTGNIKNSDGGITRCHNCSQKLITRDTYSLTDANYLLKDGVAKCPSCKETLCGVFI